jgi:hypothetical protein
MVDRSSEHPEILKEMQAYWQTCEDKYRTKVEKKQ